MFSPNTKVKILTGRYTGYTGYVVCYTDRHKLSSYDRLQVSVQTGMGWKTLLMNENNIIHST